ncbi:hypothetical protein [Rhizobium wenxiniae]|uniref:hypothetical protein n=1 Tax=Rhizobium wenxiniae TaxID=1737357 RepID=UPI003C14769E
MISRSAGGSTCRVLPHCVGRFAESREAASRSTVQLGKSFALLLDYRNCLTGAIAEKPDRFTYFLHLGGSQLSSLKGICLNLTIAVDLAGQPPVIVDRRSNVFLCSPNDLTAIGSLRSSRRFSLCLRKLSIRGGEFVFSLNGKADYSFTLRHR